MTDIVKRLRQWSAFGYGVEATATMKEAADTITALRADVERLCGFEVANRLNAAQVKAQRAEVERLTQVALAAERESKYEHFEQHIDRLGDENRELRAEVERLTARIRELEEALAARKGLHEGAVLAMAARIEKLRAALSGVLWMAEEWFNHGGDETTLADDYEKQLEAARAALEEPTAASPAAPPRS